MTSLVFLAVRVVAMVDATLRRSRSLGHSFSSQFNATRIPIKLSLNYNLALNPLLSCTSFANFVCSIAKVQSSNEVSSLN